MVNRNPEVRQPSASSVNRGAALKSLLLASVVAAASPSAVAGFATFNGGATVESLWQASVGATVLEDFESYADGTQIQSLPALHLIFDELAGGGYPQAYWFGGTPHGPMHLGNFPNGINEINRWDDTYARPTPGFTLRAMGFWNGDGQSDTLVAYAYDSSGGLLGSVGAFKGTFAGFVSDTPVAWVKFEGDTGDGWNHLDGLQVNAVPEPQTHLMMVVGVLAVGGVACAIRRSRPRA